MLCPALFGQGRKCLPVLLLPSATLERGSGVPALMLQWFPAVAVQLSSSAGYKSDTKPASFMVTVVV